MTGTTGNENVLTHGTEAGESSPSMQLLAGSVPILDEALNYFYPERACDPPAALAARMALFTLRDRIRDYVKANAPAEARCQASPAPDGSQSGLEDNR